MSDDRIGRAIPDWGLIVQDETLRGSSGAAQVCLIFKDEEHRELWLANSGLLDGDAAFDEYMRRQTNGVLTYTLGPVTPERPPLNAWVFDSGGHIVVGKKT